MSKSKRKLVALTLAAAAGLVVLLAAGLLTADAIHARRSLPHDNARAEELIRQAQTDDAYAVHVHAEWERQTQAALRREERQAALAWVVLAAAVVFVIGAKWLFTLRGQRLVLPPRLYPLPAVPAAEPAKIAQATGEPVAVRLADAGEVDLSFVDEAVAREGRGRQALIPILQALEAHYRYLPEAALRRACELTEITAAQLAGVASFYTQFRTTPVGEHLLKVCHGTACHVSGAARITDELRRHLGIARGDDTDPTRKFTIEPVACLGCCTLAPVMQIDGVTHGHLRLDTALDILSRCLERKTDGEPWRTGRVHAAAEVDAAAGEVRIGLGSCCVASGSGRVHDALEAALAATGCGAVVKRVGCVGMCHQTPLIEIDTPGRVARYARVQPEHAEAIIRRHFRPSGLVPRLRHAVVRAADRVRNGTMREVAAKHTLDLCDSGVAAFWAPQKHIATEHCGCLDPIDLDEYLAHDGCQALKRCGHELTPVEVIELIRRSGLRGRGGAGFPTAEKWTKVRQTPGGKKYVICNGDEGDPGAFMDRMLMESYPYRIIEGVAIAAYAVGATEGFFYIRREYELAVRRIRAALAECERRGLLGDDLFGTGQSLRLHVMEAAGAFVCGEETALIASLEGRRGMPSLRPPYPAQCGLWGWPTLMNNVETYAVVPWILRNGPEAFAALGTETSKGTKVFALAGKVRRGGLIEIPMGVTIREIVEEIGGGIKDGGRFKAVQIGGPSGGCVPAELADTPVDYEALVSVGAIMGSGGLVVLDETDCMVDIARYFLTFTQNQSCGQCTPCRVGTRRMLEILERLCRGEGRDDDLEKLEHLAHMVAQGSLCGLGKTASNPVLTTLRYFRSEYEAHVEGRCPAGKCKELITYSVTDACTGCTLCAQHCPADAIAMTPYEKHEIDVEKCTRCDVCRVICPEDAIKVV
jgi:NADH-quinone oxidoreductase subunit F